MKKLPQLVRHKPNTKDINTITYATLFYYSLTTESADTAKSVVEFKAAVIY